MNQNKNAIIIKIATLSMAVILAMGIGAGVLLGTDGRMVSAQTLPEITPEPTPTAEALPEPVAVFSDLAGMAVAPELDETGQLLMQYAFAEIQALEDAGEEIPEDQLFPGVHDERVIDMKLRLIDLGYLEGDEPSDYYGEQAAYSVQLFQRKAEIAQTGIADVETLRRLYEEDAPKYIVSIGMTGTDIEEIQKRLAQLGYLKVSATGYFGKDTQDAVKAFQKNNGLSADGTVGEETREALYSSDARKAGSVVSKTPTPTKKPQQTAAPTSKPSTPTSKPSSTPTATATKTPAPDSNLPSPDTAKVEQFIAYAETLKGKPYVLGGKGPDTFDCSGFIYYALNHSGVKTISYMTSAGWAKSSYPTVSKANLKRGDILCFDGHVGIYLGNNSMLDASSEEGKIRVTTNIWSKSYWVTHWKYGKRVLY